MKSLEVCLANLRGIQERWDSSLVLITSIAAVICVFCFTLTMVESLHKVMQNTARDNWAIAVRQGATAESLSAISHNEVATLSAIVDGRYDMQRHLVIPTTFSRRDDETTTGSTVLRGLAELKTADFKIMTGRLPVEGRFEVAVGYLAAEEYQGVGIDDTIDVQGISWLVVGSFSARNTLDSEVVADLDALIAAYGRRYSSVRINVSGLEVATIRDEVEATPGLRLEVLPEAEFFVAPESMGVIRFVARIVSTIMALGALVAAISVMHTAVEERAREISILRAMGFPRRTIALSIMVEALVLCMAGSLSGLVLAALIFGGATITTGSLVSVSASLNITTATMLTCLAGGAILGIVGSLFPILQGLRIPIYEGTRAKL